MVTRISPATILLVVIEEGFQVAFGGSFAAVSTTALLAQAGQVSIWEVPAGVIFSLGITKSPFAVKEAARLLAKGSETSRKAG